MIKTSINIAIILCTCCVLWAQKGQDKEPIFKPMIILGFNATQVSGDNIAGYRKYGCNCGIGTFVRLPKNFSLGFEMLYSQKGSHSSVNQVYNGDRYKAVLDYIDIPLYVSYHDKDRAIFSLGFNNALLVKHKEFMGDLEVTPDVETLKRYNLEIMLGVTFLIKKSWGVNLRYAYSIMDTRKKDAPFTGPPGNTNTLNGRWFNNVLSFRVMYIFGNQWEE